MKEVLDAFGIVHIENYEGVTHEFFGMRLVVGAARKAETLIVKHLKRALS